MTIGELLDKRCVTIADAEDHHPDVRIVNYRFLAFTTRSIGGLSENDFVMAAKVNELLG